MRRRNFLRLGSGEAIGGALAACGAGALPIAETSTPQAASQAGGVRGWHQLALRAMRDAQSSPSASVRALATLHTCIYNAWAAYDADARQTMHGRAIRLPLAERSSASKAGAISHAAYIALCDRFPAQKAIFDRHMAGLGLDPARPDAQFTPAGIGRAQASAMLDFYRRNGAEAADGAAAGLPFALVSPSQFRPANPAPPLTGEQTAGADAALVGHWCRLAQRLSARAGYDDDREVLLYFVLANALADATIAAEDAGPERASSRVAIDTAAAVVLRSFTGSDRFGAGRRIEGAEPAGLELGRKVGARVFEKARRYWQGKL